MWEPFVEDLLFQRLQDSKDQFPKGMRRFREAGQTDDVSPNAESVRKRDPHGVSSRLETSDNSRSFLILMLKLEAKVPLLTLDERRRSAESADKSASISRAVLLTSLPPLLEQRLRLLRPCAVIQTHDDGVHLREGSNAGRWRH